MNSKEKAMELVSKFGSYAYFTLGNNSMEREYEREDNSKQCALIAINEIIKLITNIEKEHAYGFKSYYWEEVKAEIEKL